MTLFTDTKRTLQQNNIRAKKGLGQHFLIDEQVIKHIIHAAELSRDDVVLEIGAGIGVLTTQLVPLVAKVIAIEIDSSLINILHQKLVSYNNVLLFKDDILKVNMGELFAGLQPGTGLQPGKGEGKIKVIANLPYYIVTPIISHLLQAKENFSTIVLMVQKEVGERLCASPGTKQYGALSVFVQYHSRIEMICEVSRECFFPEPKVDSVILRLDILDTPAIVVKNEQFFFKVVKASFSKRRKMLLNALSDIGIGKDRLVEILGEAKIDLKRRGETLSLEEFGRVSDLLGPG